MAAAVVGATEATAAEAVVAVDGVGSTARAGETMTVAARKVNANRDSPEAVKVAGRSTAATAAVEGDNIPDREEEINRTEPWLPPQMTATLSAS